VLGQQERPLDHRFKLADIARPVGKHYEELAASGAFHRAESFEEVVAGLERALAESGELATARKEVVRDVVGEVDGRAAERVVEAIVAGLGER
jgi:hypothetical protein